MRLVETSKEQGKPTALKDVAAAVNLNKVTTHRLLRSLCLSGIVRTIRDKWPLCFGPAVLAPFAKVSAKASRCEIRASLSRKIGKLTKETAIFCERYGHTDCVTIESWDSLHDTRTFSGTGILLDLLLRIFCPSHICGSFLKGHFVNHRSKKLISSTPPSLPVQETNSSTKSKK